ncbi:hypothetical protein ACFWNN_37735 [Lentzea sp. NPDC058450]|uniref:hypothetical protein n=1 Tax=Lentzea sp. NPDC058450 TaxID=3346505 RepID=UPI003653B139
MTPKIVGAAWKNKSKGTPWRGPLRKLAAQGKQATRTGRAASAVQATLAGRAALVVRATQARRAAQAMSVGRAARAVLAAGVARAEVVGLAALTALVFVAPPVQAQGARVAATPASADPEYATTLSLRGSGFQSVKNGYGGIYVFFGWVSEQWRPSQGGASGTTMRYVQDREAKDNNGYQRFISFPGGETEQAANGVVNADGSWSAQLNVPGARFKTAGRDGAVSEVDCTKVTCGVITIGAHGVVNANNETFTPIRFAVPNQPTQPNPPAQQNTTTTQVPTTTTTAVPTTTTTTTTTTETTTQPEVLPAAQAGPDERPGWLIGGGIGAAVLLAAGLVWWLWFRRGRNA